MSPRLAPLAAVAVLIAARTAPAQPGAPAKPAPAARAASPADVLVEAGAALSAGDPARARALAGRVARDPGPVARPDRAEAWRILGLAQHALRQREGAAAAFYQYLKLDPDAHLDPALVPIAALTLFEEVRSRHAAELAALRPARRRPSAWLNLVPLGGQWQNGDRGKMWLFGATGAALLAANISSYAVLRRWCGGGEASTCDEGRPGEPGYVDHRDQARTLQVVNIASGVGLIALYTYSVVDGYLGYQDWRADEARRQAAPVALGAHTDGESVVFTFSGGF